MGQSDCWQKSQCWHILLFCDGCWLVVALGGDLKCWKNLARIGRDAVFSRLSVGAGVVVVVGVGVSILLRLLTIDSFQIFTSFHCSKHK